MKPTKRIEAPGGKTISLRLQDNKLKQLDALANSVGMTRSSLIQLAVERLLKQGL